MADFHKKQKEMENNLLVIRKNPSIALITQVEK